MPIQILPADVRAYAIFTMGWSPALFAKVEPEFYLYRTMRWSSATWEEIRDALTEVLNEVCGDAPACAVKGRHTVRL